MPRPVSDDLLQSFRYRVMEVDGDGKLGHLEGKAGFNSVTTPEVSQDVAEYREGNVVYTKKFPGVPTVENITLSKGVAQKDSSFWDWGLAALSGRAFRSDLVINSYAPDENGTLDTHTPARQLLCKNVFPVRVKPMGDLDATSSDVNLQEIDGAMEELALTIISNATAGITQPTIANS